MLIILGLKWYPVIIAIIILLSCYYHTFRQLNRKFWQNITVYSCLVYLLVLCWLVFTPVGPQMPDSYKPLMYFHGVPYNLRPLQNIDPEFLANIVMTIPLGCYVYCWRPRLKSWQLLLIALIPGAIIESAQFVRDLLVGNHRVADIDDVITNTLGVLVGYGVFWLVSKTPGDRLLKYFRLWKIKPLICFVPN